MKNEKKGVGKIFLEKNKETKEIEAMRIFIGKKIANLKLFENKEQVKVYVYPTEKKIIITKFY